MDLDNVEKASESLKFLIALDEFEDNDSYSGPVTKTTYDTIRLALRIADKAMQEPSGDMLDASDQYFIDLQDVDVCKGFRAMIEQMIKEIGE